VILICKAYEYRNDLWRIHFRDGLVGNSSSYLPGNTSTYKPGNTSTYLPGNTSTYKPGNTSTYKPGNTSTYLPGNTSTYKPGNTSTYKPGNTSNHKPSKASTYLTGNTSNYKPGNTSTYKPGNTSNHKPSKASTYLTGNTSNYKPGSTSTYSPGNTSTYKPGNTSTHLAGNLSSYKPERIYSPMNQITSIFYQEKTSMNINNFLSTPIQYDYTDFSTQSIDMENPISNEMFTKQTVFLLTIIGMSFVLVLLIVILFWKLIIPNLRKKKMRKVVSEFDELNRWSIDSNSPSILSSYGISYGGRTLNSLNTKTRVYQEMGISIPGYLQFSAQYAYKPCKLMTRGGFGNVYLVDLLDEHLIRTASSEKAIAKQASRSMEEKMHLNAFYQEVSIMSYLRNHPNIALIIGFCEDPHTILMKYYKLGSLQRWLYKPEFRKTKSILIGFIHDIGSGLLFMHEKGIAHCDIKPLNILLEKNHETGRITCLLTDFGISQICDESKLDSAHFKIANLKAGSIGYMAPELLLSYYGEAKIQDVRITDLYSFGVIMQEIVCRDYPWYVQEERMNLK
jgi:tRNA A-37 threonylcarbamoyl transferase component Bud32